MVLPSASAVDGAAVCYNQSRTILGFLVMGGDSSRPCRASQLNNDMEHDVCLCLIAVD